MTDSLVDIQDSHAGLVEFEVEPSASGVQLAVTRMRTELYGSQLKRLAVALLMNECLNLSRLLCVQAQR